MILSPIYRFKVISRLYSLTVVSRRRIMSDKINFPFVTEGEVVKGFGRGSKQLGIPTANFPESVVDQLPSSFICGIYYGLAQVDSESVMKMVMSIGYNPYYHNQKKSMETHVIHDFDGDFYGSNLKVCIMGFLRPEENYDSLDDLIAAIKNDIANAKKNLDDSTIKSYLHYFSSPNGNHKGDQS